MMFPCYLARNQVLSVIFPMASPSYQGNVESAQLSLSMLIFPLWLSLTCS